MAVENWPVGWFFCKLLKQPFYWLMMLNLCILVTNSPLSAIPAPLDVIKLVFALLASGGLAVLLEAFLLRFFGDVAAPARFRVAISWRRSAGHGAMLATATLVTTPIALQQHWHTSGLWLIITPLLVLQPFVRDSWTATLHRSLGTLAGVLLVYLFAITLPRNVPLDLAAIAMGVITVVIAVNHGHRALMLTSLTVTIVLFNSSNADLMLMADKRVFASAIGIIIALSLMALAHPIERMVAQSARG